VEIVLDFIYTNNVVVPAIFPLVSSSATNILCNKLDFIFCKIPLAYSLSLKSVGSKLLNASKVDISFNDNANNANTSTLVFK
jgi:hypothetical protein